MLLLKGASDKKLWANLYNGIGGHIDPGEDIISSAQRELHEETGLVGIQIDLCGTILINDNQETGICIFVFTGYSNPRLVQNSSEGSLEWVQITDIDKLDLVEDLPVLLPIILKWKPGDRLFAANYRYGHQGELQINFHASSTFSDD